MLLTGLVLAAGVLAAGATDRKTYSYLQVFREVLGLTRQNYVETTDESQLLEGAYRGMVASLDAASAYLAPGEELELQSPPGPGRTGMEVLPSGGAAVVVRVDPGSPGEKAGFKVGDQIWRIGDRPARQLAWPILRQRLSGPLGAALQLTVLNAETFKLETRTLTLAPLAGRGFDLDLRSDAVLHLRLRELEQLDPAVLQRALQTAQTAHRDAPLLIDVRGVVGLEPQRLAGLAGVLYDGGALLALQGRSGEPTAIEAPARPKPSLPRVAVLIDGSTAGTGEALALLLKERSGAQLYGRQSFGLGAIPELIPLQSGGTLLLTTREMRTSAGSSWSKDGVKPDTIVTPPGARGDEDSAGTDPLLLETIRLLRVDLHAATKPAA